MHVKYDLNKILAEIKEDEKVFEQKEHYWASQKEIQDLLKKMRKEKAAK
ncbi:MAG: hypothetical protein OEY01_15455 [Desulfobulbaceae bacterium]|nr:hypothetical protein [Desulfobulbaceae bacterium]